MDELIRLAAVAGSGIATGLLATCVAAVILRVAGKL